ncbi:hypothetical protein Skr01_36640 [Sphaerisporangium krabiense]|uniref:Uncharacterized protein n=1 Tax=Sphaerisporangium krabiense TaxID=763782 RepID=A0A7W8Z3C4_9ACTN|nr:hypothetical protein [Sphaerisporangium krabiense]MBB5626659.1 hypothetical protein [Sphaerisporangium krabiense]GII63579.1 hypothetical protein Skr01_36640 [Sphaerisporangium krabiense]
MTPEELNAIKARVNAASAGPWERGDVYLTAGVGFGMPPGQCAFCRLGDPVWSGDANINGRMMPAHRHRDPNPYEPDHKITGSNGEVVAGNYDYEAGGIIEPADTEFIVHARTDVPALVAEIERIRRFIDEDFRYWCSPNGVAGRYAKDILAVIDQPRSAS